MKDLHQRSSGYEPNEITTSLIRYVKQGTFLSVLLLHHTDIDVPAEGIAPPPLLYHRKFYVAECTFKSYKMRFSGIEPN